MTTRSLALTFPSPSSRDAGEVCVADVQPETILLQNYFDLIRVVPDTDLYARHREPPLGGVAIQGKRSGQSLELLRRFAPRNDGEESA